MGGGFLGGSAETGYNRHRRYAPSSSSSLGLRRYRDVLEAALLFGDTHPVGGAREGHPVGLWRGSWSPTQGVRPLSFSLRDCSGEHKCPATLDQPLALDPTRWRR